MTSTLPLTPFFIVCPFWYTSQIPGFIIEEKHRTIHHVHKHLLRDPHGNGLAQPLFPNQKQTAINRAPPCYLTLVSYTISWRALMMFSLA